MSKNVKVKGFSSALKAGLAAARLINRGIDRVALLDDRGGSGHVLLVVEENAIVRHGDNGFELKPASGMLLV